MKVYLQPPQPSRGLQRIADALRRYAPPSIEVLSFPRNADLTVIYAIGRRDAVQRQVDDIRRRGKEYAIIQVCLRSTMSSRAQDWLDIWGWAEVVWSYYNLKQAYIDDGGASNDCFDDWPLNFYHAPLGVDASTFYPRYKAKAYMIATSGSSRLSESVREAKLAAEALDQSVFHLGTVNLGPRHLSLTGISDDQLAQMYSACHFVSGLRRKEGFELPAAEGLLCGARPLVFDNPDWRFNYKEWAEYLHEGTRQEVVDQLVQLFRQGARPVTAHEREEAAHWFNWERVCGEFWQRCL